MRLHYRFVLLLLASALMASCYGKSSGSSNESESEEPAEQEEPEVPGESAEERTARLERERQARIDRDYPSYGVITGAQLTVRAEADSEALTVGWLRRGGVVRLKSEPTRAGGCASGWYEVYPRGYACAGQGIDVSESAPSETPPGANIAEAMPYTYYFVKENMVPEYHQLPSRDAQRAALTFGQRYMEIKAENPRRAANLLNLGLVGEPDKPAAVRGFLDHGFMVAGEVIEVRSRRRFVRTTRGTFVKQNQLEEKTGSEFQGVVLNAERTLPIAFTIRPTRLLIRQESEGTVRWVRDESQEPLAKRTVVENWQERKRVGGDVMHRIGDDRWAKAWFIGVAEKIAKPAGVGDDDVWVHVDISEQTLVVYRGETPIYATLVSSGLPEHDTPRGEYTIQKKYVTNTMSNLNAGEDRYAIQDVPYTQYFEGSFALHAAFWHYSFGQQKSHGCVNLAPRDAQAVWQLTDPQIPEGWHGVNTERTGFEGSRVVVTD